LVVGVFVGFVWGMIAGDGYEAGDSAAGTAFLCGLAGTLVGGIALHIAERRDQAATADPVSADSVGGDPVSGVAAGAGAVRPVTGSGLRGRGRHRLSGFRSQVG
jgi:hypothetical protein